MSELNNSDGQVMPDSEGAERPQRPKPHSQGDLQPLLPDTLDDGSEKLELAQGSEREVVIVLVLGTLGAGKSSFIDKATENTGRGVGHGLSCGTKEVTFIEGLSTDGSSVDLVDTPGLDGERQSPITILGKVSTRLNEKYGTGTKPSVILYFQPISHSHVVGHPLKVIEMLQELWGKDVISRVFFVTTMWDEIEDPADGQERLTELEDQGTILREYTLLKHLDTRDSSMRLLDGVVQWAKKQVEIQLTEDMDRAGVKDIIIALVGSTGTGKSSFVGKVSGDTGEGVGHSLTSCTSNIKATRCVVNGFNVILVDTPGLNHTNKLEIEVPKMISNWLDITYETRPIPLAVLYFHRISDNRNPASTPIKILRDFQKLCGNNTASRVSLVTTMWDEVEDDVGEERLKELKENYWSMMISRGSTAFKYLNTQDSAMQLLGFVVEQTIGQEELQLHEEISGMKLELQETTTGQELCSRLDKLENKRNDILRRIRVESKTAEQETMRDLWKEFAQVKARLDSALTESRTLRTTRMRMKWIKIIFAKMVVHRWVDLRRRGRK